MIRKFIHTIFNLQFGYFRIVRKTVVEKKHSKVKTKWEVTPVL